MIKRTLYFGNPVYLSKNLEQLVIRLPEVEKNETIPSAFKKNAHTTIPIEDIGIVVLDNQQITISQGLIDSLLENNVAIISCDKTHHPTGLMIPLCGNKIQTERFKAQIEASEPLKKQLWQQTIKAKIRNQASLLKQQNVEIKNMLYWADSVTSGDTENHEARAAAYYWKNLFSPKLDFRRDRDGLPPNNLLNYGYAILRATVARGLVSSGLLPTLGIFHRNKYNAYCLADDIMEPYRPFVDKIVLDIIKVMPYEQLETSVSELTPELKKQLLIIPAIDIKIDGERSPLMVGLQRTTSSLVKCFEGNNRKLIYPENV